MANDLLGDAAPHRVSIDTMRKEIDRELNMRRSVYPRLIDQGKMTHDQAAQKIRILEATAILMQTLLDCAADVETMLGASDVHDYNAWDLYSALKNGVEIK